MTKGAAIALEPKTETAIEVLQSGPFSLRELAIEKFDGFFESILEQNALTPEQQVELGDQLKSSIEKRDQVGAFLRRCELEGEILRNEEKRLAARRMQFEKIGRVFEDSLKLQLENWGVTKVEGNKFTFAIQKNPPSVSIENEAELPAEFIKYVAQPDKLAIRDALKDGKEVSGATLVCGTRLVIK